MLNHLKQQKVHQTSSNSEFHAPLQASQNITKQRENTHRPPIIVIKNGQQVASMNQVKQLVFKQKQEALDQIIKAQKFGSTGGSFEKNTVF